VALGDEWNSLVNTSYPETVEGDVISHAAIDSSRIFQTILIQYFGQIQREVLSANAFAGNTRLQR